MCCAIACCYDNGGLSEKEGRGLAVFSDAREHWVKSGGHIGFVARTQNWKWTENLTKYEITDKLAELQKYWK